MPISNEIRKILEELAGEMGVEIQFGRIVEALAKPEQRGAASPGQTLPRGVMARHLADVWPPEAVLTLEPGDIMANSDIVPEGFNLASPIGYDVWYLWVYERLLPADPTQAEDWITGSTGRLKDVFDRLYGMRPMRSLDNFASISGYKSNAAPNIKLARYETLLHGQAPDNPSPGQPDTVCGYLAFTVGQVGAMEVISIVRESMTDEQLSVTRVAATAGISTNMMPPANDGQNNLAGIHIVELGYVVQGDEVEIHAAEFSDTDALPEYWMRRYLMEEDEWPVPGEFLAVCCRPVSYHVWWYQDTCPFVYAGNWVETEYYTSGIVTAVTGEGIEREYTVKVKGVAVEGVQATDFFEYQVDDRVAIIKHFDVSSGPFTWDDMAESDAGWEIIPVSFYEL